jgi:hypothetical protein
MPYAPRAELSCWGRRLVCSLLLCYCMVRLSLLLVTPLLLLLPYCVRHRNRAAVGKLCDFCEFCSLGKYDAVVLKLHRRIH